MSVERIHRSSPIDVRGADSLGGPAPQTRRIAERTQWAAPGQLAARARSSSRTAAKPPTEREIQQRLNDQLERMSGPYRVNGKEVRAFAGFRMNGGLNQLTAAQYLNKLKQALPNKTFALLSPMLGYVVAGKGSPEQIRTVTQALIDSPAWSSYSRLPPEHGIRKLMWDFGIGADCSGYVHNAFLATRGAGSSRAAGRYGLGDALQSNLQHPPASIFRKVEPAKARAGDVMLLKNGDDGTGHKVIVFANHDVPKHSELHARIASQLGSSEEARIDLIEVDSSWGAGGEPLNGGVKREVFAYDESTNKWASLTKDSRGQWQVIASSKSGPYDHELAGIYRPRDEN